MLERLSWKRLALELLCCCLVAAILGVIFGYLPWFLCAAITALLIWHFWNLLRLSWWLWVDRSMTPPPGKGSWEPLLYGLHQMLLRNKKRRKELGYLIKRFRSGAESLPDAVVLTTEDGIIFWCNGLAQQLFGLRWPDDSGQNIQNLLRYPELTRYLTRNDFTNPLTIVLNNGCHIEFRMMPYAYGQRLIVARDVTQLRQSEEVRRHFFANVSHELRTPLTVLQGYLEIIQDHDLDTDMREKAIYTMREQTSRMDALVKQLLMLSRIESAPVTLLNQKIDVPLMLHTVKQEAQALSQDSHRFIFHVEPDLVILGNEEQMRSAISNLVYNAVNHTPPGTEITVQWRRTTQGVLFSVKDNGPGIGAEHLPHLTERFYRVDKARSRDTGGSGLGLAIVKHALHHHSTRLDITSAPGEGSNFSFVLPARLIVHKLPIATS